MYTEQTTLPTRTHEAVSLDYLPSLPKLIRRFNGGGEGVCSDITSGVEDFMTLYGGFRLKLNFVHNLLGNCMETATFGMFGVFC